MDKKFLVAGTSTLKGKIVARFANGTAKARSKVLVKNGDTDIFLVDLSKSLTKVEAVAELRERFATAFTFDQFITLEAAAGGSKLTAPKKAKTVKETVKKAAAKTKVKAVKSESEKSDVKASNLEKIRAAATAAKARKVKVVDTTKDEIEFAIDEDADAEFVKSEFAPQERGARLAEEI